MHVVYPFGIELVGHIVEEADLECLHNERNRYCRAGTIEEGRDLPRGARYMYKDDELVLGEHCNDEACRMGIIDILETWLRFNDRPTFGVDDCETRTVYFQPP